MRGNSYSEAPASKEKQTKNYLHYSLVVTNSADEREWTSRPFQTLSLFRDLSLLTFTTTKHKRKRQSLWVFECVSGSEYSVIISFLSEKAAIILQPPHRLCIHSYQTLKTITDSFIKPLNPSLNFLKYHPHFYPHCSCLKQYKPLPDFCLFNSLSLEVISIVFPSCKPHQNPSYLKIILR